MVNPTSGVRGPGGTAAARRTAASGGFGWRGAEAAGAPALRGTAGAEAVGLLLLQEPDAAGGRDGRAARRGGALLRELRALQAERLGAAADPERLRRIAALAEGEPADDPALREALDGVVLRARVELARAGGG